MGRSRRTLDRKSLRDQSDAAERQKEKENEELEDEDEDEDDDEDEDEDAEASADDDEEGGGDDDDDDDEEEKPKPKKKKAAAKPKVTKTRTRTAKVVRMRVVWGVYTNSHQLHEEYDYPKRKDAEERVAQLNTDKKSGHPFFVQPLKKPMDKEK